MIYITLFQNYLIPKVIIQIKKLKTQLGSRLVKYKISTITISSTHSIEDTVDETSIKNMPKEENKGKSRRKVNGVNNIMTIISIVLSLSLHT